MMQVVTEPNVGSYNAIKTTLDSKYNVKIEDIALDKTTLKTADGINLETFVYKNPKPSGKVIILSHGIRQSGYWMLSFFPMYQALGFDIVGFSYRNHGSSSKTATTYGKDEVTDLQTVVDYAHSQFGDKVTYGIHGVSMGAAIMLQYAAQAKEQHKYQFLISDCAFADLGQLLKTRLNEDYPAISFLPLVQSSSFTSQLVGRGSFFDIVPQRSVEKIEVPILFVHGKKDTYIPLEHVHQLYEKKHDKKQLLEVEEGTHAENYLFGKAVYEEAVKNFINV